jgi:hypothetical protein
VLYFAGWKQHYSLYPAGERMVVAFKDQLASYKVSKSTIRFPLSEGGRCEVDRTHREVPRGGSRPAGEVKTSRPEEALGRRFWHCPQAVRASHNASLTLASLAGSGLQVP